MGHTDQLSIVARRNRSKGRRELAEVPDYGVIVDSRQRSRRIQTPVVLAGEDKEEREGNGAAVLVLRGLRSLSCQLENSVSEKTIPEIACRSDSQVVVNRYSEKKTQRKKENFAEVPDSEQIAKAQHRSILLLNLKTHRRDWRIRNLIISRSCCKSEVAEEWPQFPHSCLRRGSEDCWVN
ncbi:hypothetical protein MRB53_015707 [Persea americana]|uniref:Uncharacterized protein n=1 Tax=Persea americana TaxID=3435 RepID=A0ACC2M0M0_PERAE|nr:hypothetical protein MRB53_015707 [Persea americana]